LLLPHAYCRTQFEWLDPDAVTTKDGNLEITITEEPIHGLNFRSGMIQVRASTDHSPAAR
jgi:beta-glucanase (GH16 family)